MATDLPVSKPKLQWMTATVGEIIDETPRVRSLVLDIPDWPGHRAGQHVDVRLTSDDGYQAQRSYSIASPPEASHVMLTVERLSDGEVSSYLAGDLIVGDQFELRGPIGGYFVWTAALGGPVFLVGGGSGVVPLMSMLRHRVAAKSNVPTTLLYSSRTPEDIIYRAELDALAGQGDGFTLVHTLTRQQPVKWSGLKRRIDRDMLQSVGFAPDLKPRIFICGPTPLVEQAARDMRGLGHAAQLIKTERFGPTGR
jgi:ferredoxin-NADP reductase